VPIRTERSKARPGTHLRPELSKWPSRLTWKCPTSPRSRRHDPTRRPSGAQRPHGLGNRAQTFAVASAFAPLMNHAMQIERTVAAGPVSSEICRTSRPCRRIQAAYLSHPRARRRPADHADPLPPRGPRPIAGASPSLPDDQKEASPTSPSLTSPSSAVALLTVVAYPTANFSEATQSVIRRAGVLLGQVTQFNDQRETNGERSKRPSALPVVPRSVLLPRPCR